MRVKQFKTGGDRNFGYVVADDVGKEAAIIDPSYAPARLAEFCGENDFTIRYVFNTHGHPDHTNGNEEILTLTGVQPLLFGDEDPLTGERVLDGAQFPLGDLQIRILHTPGHTDDSICIVVADAVFTGDTLFVGKVGGTDFGENARAEYKALHEKLLALPDATRVFPGHDFGVDPESTIGRERASNPFLLQPDVESFIDLKKNWLAYKKEHGIA